MSQLTHYITQQNQGAGDHLRPTGTLDQGVGPVHVGSGAGTEAHVQTIYGFWVS